MLRPVRALPFILSLLLMMALLTVGAACGGGKSKSGAKPTATATEEAPSTSGESPFDSFHYTVGLGFSIEAAPSGEGGVISGSVEGDFMAPDSHSFTSKFEFAGISSTEEAVIIGDDAWYRASGGEWRATTRNDPDVASAIGLTSADPTFLFSDELSRDLAALDSETEAINGVQTKRYHIPRETVAALASIFGEGFIKDASGLQEFEMTVWVEEETGALVKADLAATAGPEIFGTADAPFDLPPDATITVTISINLTQTNDPSITIEPPI